MQKSDDDERVGLDFFYLFEDDENLKKTSISSFEQQTRKKTAGLKKQGKTSSSRRNLSRSSDKV